MPRRPLVNKELRCFCLRHPLLATYGVDSDGRLFVHVKIFKQRRVYGEMVVTDGTVKLLCRDCFRWHEVIIRQPERMELKEVSKPDGVGDDVLPECLPEPHSAQ